MAEKDCAEKTHPSELTEHELNTVAGGWLGGYAHGGWVPIPPNSGGAFVGLRQGQGRR